MTNRDLNHSVWEVYNLLRTARLNSKYYSEKLHRVERLNTTMQIVIAASLPSSAIAGFQIWTVGLGNVIWNVVLVASSMLAFVQPFLKLSEKIKKYDSILNGYLMLDYDLQELRGKISNSRKYNSSHKRLFEQALKRKKNVGIKEQGIKVDTKLRNKCTLEVNNELPAENFYVPEKANGTN